MNAPVSPVILLDAVRRAKLKRAAESSLYKFTRQAWQVIEPGTTFVDGWHIRAICDHLEAVSNREIRQLLITMPPRHAKSLLVAVMWPCWTWIAAPQFRWLFSSYAGSLSVRDSLKCRRLVQSDWYQENWGDRFQLVGDQNAKTFFETSKYGYRFATSVGASTTGHGGDAIVCDDPHNAMEAQSDAVRTSTLEWWDQAMSTRLNDPKRGVRVVVQQRLHELDLAGHILRKGGWEHLNLPAEYEGVKFKTSIGWEDPRDSKGSLLWPEQFDAKSLEELKKALGEYGTAGQLQQRPAPAGGGILRVKHFQLWPKDRELPVFDYVTQSYDCAFTEKTTGDPTACTVWGVFTDKGRRGAMLLDAWSDHLAYPQLRAKAVEEWHSVYGKSEARKGKKADSVLVEAKASGQSLIQDLRQANVPAVPYNPGNADKINRAHQAAPILELDCLYIPESGKSPGEFVSWAKGFVGQCEKFPNAEHDDYVDTFTQAVIYLRDGQWFDLDRAADDEVEEADYYSSKKAQRNPYAA